SFDAEPLRLVREVALVALADAQLVAVLVLRPGGGRARWSAFHDGDGASFGNVNPRPGVLVEEDFDPDLLGRVAELRISGLPNRQVHAGEPLRSLDVLGRSKTGGRDGSDVAGLREIEEGLELAVDVRFAAEVARLVRKLLLVRLAGLQFQPVRPRPGLGA